MRVKETQPELELSTLLRSAWKRRRLVCLLVFLPSLGVGLFMRLRPSAYEVIVLVDPGVVWNLPIYSSASLSEIVASDFFLDRLIHRLAWLQERNATPAALRKGMVSAKISSTGFLAIRLRADKAERALELAQAATAAIMETLASDYKTSRDAHAEQARALRVQIRGVEQSGKRFVASLARGGQDSQAHMAAMTVALQSMAALTQGLDMFTREPRVVAPPVLPKAPQAQSPVATVLFTLCCSLLAAVTVVILLDF